MAKYMHLNSSCSYCSLNYMLLKFDEDVTDVDIAISMKLPYLFNKDEKDYSAGPMLQNHKWFNLYLNPLGLEMKEKIIHKNGIVEYLFNNPNSMLGLKTEYGKHAVVFIEKKVDKMVFFNPKWEISHAHDILELDIDEVLNRIDEMVMVATLRKSEAKKINFKPLLLESCRFLNDYFYDLSKFVKEKECKMIIKII